MNYYTDEELEELYGGYSIVNIEWGPSGNSARITLEREEKTFSDSFIIYESSKIAFDNWYLET
jgi:hypothetical protein